MYRVFEFRVFNARNGQEIQDLAGRVSRRKIETANDLVNLVAEYLCWTGASATDVEFGVNTMHLSRVHPNGNGYRIRATR